MAAVLRDVSDWQCIDYLLKQNLQELINHQRWNLNYYLQAVFDLTGASAIDKILKEHNFNLSNEERYAICFRFRHVPEFLKRIVEEKYGNSSSAGAGRTGKSKETVTADGLDKDNPLLKTLSEISPRLYFSKENTLKDYAEAHIKETQALAERLCRQLKFDKIDEFEVLFNDILLRNLRRKRKVNLKVEWKKYTETHKNYEIKYDAFRKRYYRFIDKFPSGKVVSSRWPTKSFISFLAYISVRYELVDNGPGSIPSVILIGKDDPPGLLQHIWRLAKLFPESETSLQVERQTVNRVMRWCERRGLSIEEKVQKLKSLICQNNIFAINKLKEISPDDYEQSDEIKLCEAMLSPQKYGDRRGWNVPMTQHLFEPCHRFRGIRTHKVEWLLGRFYPPRTVIRKIGLEVHKGNPNRHQNPIVASPPNAWIEMASTLVQLPGNDIVRFEIPNPTPYDFDKIMTLGDVIVTISFYISDKEEISYRKRSWCSQESKT